MPPHVITTCDEITEVATAVRRAGKTLGLVPTMGALHAGHLSLVHRAAQQCDHVIATIFVNPTQFGPSEDLTQYPRTLDADVKSLARLRVDYVFSPDEGQMYAADHSTYVEPPEVAHHLEGMFRPTHFRGVATIVLKLFHLIPADVSYFGEKDYQQLAVIRQMVKDLNVPIRVEGCPTIREEDGLAMSSRNAYLSPAERKQATALHRSLMLARELAAQGESSAARIAANMRRVIADAGIEQIDYITIADATTLEEVSEIDAPAVALIAARVGRTRLIDNMRL